MSTHFYHNRNQSKDNRRRKDFSTVVVLDEEDILAVIMMKGNASSMNKATENKGILWLHGIPYCKLLNYYKLSSLLISLLELLNFSTGISGIERDSYYMFIVYMCVFQMIDILHFVFSLTLIGCFFFFLLPLNFG